MRVQMLTAALVAVGLLAAAPGTAHELWWEKEDGGFRLAYGHLPSSREACSEIPYTPEDVARVHCLRDDGGIMTYLDLPAAPVRVSGPYAALHVDMVPEVWTKTTHGTVKRPRAEGETALFSWESRESAKHILRWHPELARPLGESLEIVPAADPTALAPGSTVRLTVFLDGLAVEGAVVSHNGESLGVTGPDGRIDVRIGKDGFQYFRAVLERALDAPRADRVMHTAGLGFESGSSR